MLILLVGKPRTWVVIVRVRLRVQKSLVRLVEMGNQLMGHSYGSQQAIDVYGLRCTDHPGDFPVYGIDGVAGAVQRMQHLPRWWRWACLRLCRRLLLCVWPSRTRRQGPCTWHMCLRCLLRMRRMGTLRKLGVRVNVGRKGRMRKCLVGPGRIWWRPSGRHLIGESLGFLQGAIQPVCWRLCLNW